MSPARPSGFVTERLGLVGAGIATKRNGCRSPRAAAGPVRLAALHVATSSAPRLQKSCVRFHQWPLRWRKHVNGTSLSFRRLWKH